MPTNIGGVLLGDLVLGASNGPQVYNREVTSTLSFTQAIALGFQAVENTLTFSQDITFTRAYFRTVTSTYSPTQTIKTIKTENVESTLVLSQNIAYEKTKPVSVTSTFTPTQTIDRAYIGSRLIVSGITWTQTVGRNAVFDRSISHSLSLSQTIVAHHTKHVISTLNLSQSISYVKLKHVQHTIPWQQELTYNAVLTRQNITLFQPFQTIARNVVYNRTVIHNYVPSHTITVHKVKEVSHTLNLTQTIVAYASRGVSNVYAPTQTIDRNINYGREVEQTLNLTQSIILNRTRVLHVKHAFAPNQTVKKSTVHSQSVGHMLNLTHENCRTRHNESVTSTLNLTQTIAYTPVYPLSVSQTLSLGQTIGLTKVLARSVSHVLEFKPNRTVYVGMGDSEFLTIDNIQWQIVPGGELGDYQIDANLAGMIWIQRPSRKKRKRKYCVLKTTNAAITLPAPEFNDGENYGGIFTIRRAMNGTPYTYVRNLDLRKLRLPFSLDKAKAWELREFLIENNTRTMELLTWKGDKWFVFLMSNPTEFTVTHRREAANEGVAVTLEFEGLKVM